VQRIENEAKTRHVADTWCQVADTSAATPASGSHLYEVSGGAVAADQSGGDTWHYSGGWNTLVYEQVPCDDQNYAYTNIHTILRVHHNSFTIVRSVEYHIDQSPPQDLEFKRLLKIEIDRLREDVLGTQIPNPPFYLDTKESDDDTEVIFDNELFLRERNTALVTPHAYTPSLPFLTTMEPADTLLIGDEDSSTNLVRETDKFIKSSVDDLVSIPRESEVTLDSNLECDMPVNTPLPTTDVKEENFDINSPLGEHVVDFLMENEDIADLPRHLFLSSLPFYPFDSSTCLRITILVACGVEVRLMVEIVLGCSSVGSGNEFVYDPNPYSYNETPNFFNQAPQHQYETYSFKIEELQAEINHLQEMLRFRNLNHDPPVDLYDLEGSDEGGIEIDSLTKEPLDTLLMGDEKEDFDINSPLGEQVVDFLIENEDVAGLPRHLVKRLFSHLVKNLSSTKRMFDEPLGDDSKPRSYDVTFSNSLFEFNDDYTLCYDNPLFDDEFEDISSLDPLIRLQWEDEGDGDPFFDFHHMPSPHPVAYYRMKMM
ncbi:hypothetical protein Tco_0866573, partial [Tanacetum coccineum]